MKKLFALTVAALALAACGASKENANNRIDTLPVGFDMKNIAEATLPATFSDSCFNWRDMTLTFNASAETMYDAKAIDNMKKGDTLVYEQKPMVVDSISKENNILSVNGGLEEGGAWLVPADGGKKYRAMQFDDHSVYFDLGKATLPLASDFTIIDCHSEPQEPSDTITNNQKQYIESLSKQEFPRNNFNNLDTRLTVKGGKIVNITRIWIP